MVFGNYDARTKCLQNVSVIISKYPETISVMIVLTVSQLTNFNGQGENIVNNGDFIDTNVSSPNNDLNKAVDNVQRDSEIEDLTEKK